MEQPNTLAKAVWDFHEKIRFQAEYHSIANSVVDDALADIGYGQPELGAGVVVYCSRTLAALPTGSLVYRGDPADWARFTLYSTDRGNYHRRVLGQDYPLEVSAGKVSAGLTLASLGTDARRAPWLDLAPADGEAERIAEFRTKAAKVGWKYKRAQDWCTTFDGCMATAGVSL